MKIASMKQHTEHLHRRLEDQVDIVRKVQSLPDYASLLARFYGFYEPFERRLAGVEGLQDLGLDLPARRKAHLLAGDLAHLGCNAALVAKLPRCEDLPEPRTTAEGLGCLYVVEGATLGGRILLKHFRQTLGTDDDCTAFFASYGENVGPMWQRFCSVVEESVITTEEQGRAQAMAAETFEAFGAWLAAPEPALYLVQDGGGP